MTGGCPDRFGREMLCPCADGQCNSDEGVSMIEQERVESHMCLWLASFLLVMRVR